MKKFLNGIIIGISNIVPGICSATVSIILGVYQDLLDGLGHLFNIKKIKKYFILYIGIIVGIIIGVFVLNYLYKKIPTILSLVFLGVVIRNFPVKFKNVDTIKKDRWLFILGMLIVVGMSLLKANIIKVDYSKLSISSIIFIAFCSIFSGLAMILPGISGALILVVFGLYFPLLNSLTTLLESLVSFSLPNLNNLILILVFSFTFLCSLIFCSNGVNILLKKYPSKFLYFINGMIVGSIFNIIFEISSYEFNIIHATIGVILFLLIVLMKKK